MPLKYFKHMKTYDGVLESSFMFFMQVSNPSILKGTPAKNHCAILLLELGHFFGIFSLCLDGLTKSHPLNGLGMNPKTT